MKTIEQTVEDFCTENGIRFQLATINGDGEMVAKYSSEFDASDVAGYAGLLDEKIMQLAIADANAKGEDDE